MRFIQRWSVGQQLALQSVLVALALGHLGYRVAAASNDPWGLAFAGTALLAAGALCYAIARRVATGRERMLASVRRLSRGELTAAVPVTDDPIDAALAELQGAMRVRVEAAGVRALESTRLLTALDKLPSNVMVADPDGKIVYMNEAATAMFRGNSAEIRKQLPRFDVDKVLGSSFDSFHKVPSHQRNLLAQLRGKHAADVHLGQAVLRVAATPISDTAGQRLGTVVLWLDRTAEATIEADVERIVAAANDGNLTQRIALAGLSGFAAVLASGVNSLLDQQLELVRHVQALVREVSSAADEIAKGNQNLSQRTEAQAASLEETASSMEEMTSTVRQNANNAAQASQLAAAARLQAEKGGSVVAEAVTAMQGINAASSKIADILGVIDELAFQTNLLALNAAVEAARAGEQGRGFAVVASEVRNLASRSAAAAKEIKALIQDNVGRVAQGSTLVDQSGATLTEIVASVKKVTDIVSEIAAASAEQSSGIEQVNKAVSSMDEGTQQNAALVEQAAAAAAALLDQAKNLNALVARYIVGQGAAPPRELPREELAPRRVPVERRSAIRPWSRGAGPGAAPKTPPLAAHPAPPRSTGASGGDDWTEF